MPLYEYRCRTCEQKFELRRSLREALTPAPCPDGHDDTVRLLSTFAVAHTTSTAERSASSGGCCGGACGCAH